MSYPPPTPLLTPIPPTLNVQVLTTGSVWPTGVTLPLHRTQATLSGLMRAYWVGVGVVSGGGGALSTHPAPPRPGRHRQREQVCGKERILTAISVSSQSVFSASHTLAHTCLQVRRRVCCHKCDTVSCCLKWISPPPPPLFLCFSPNFPTWPHHRRATQ